MIGSFHYWPLCPYKSMKYCLGFLLGLGIHMAPCQSVTFIGSPRWVLGTEKQKSASIGYGDIDQDGDIDILVANGRHWPEQNKVYFNNGLGIFTVSKSLGGQSTTSYATVLGDIDGDGDLDVIVGNDMAPNCIFKNDGKGHFTKGNDFGEAYAPTRNLVLSDIDQDGDLDILITNRGSQNEICINDSKGQFNEKLGFGTADDSTIDMKVADMDGDGDLGG